MTYDEGKKKTNETETRHQTDDNNIDIEKVVNDYDSFMQECLITTSSFHNIDSRKLDSRKRYQQLLFVTYYTIQSTLCTLFIWSYRQDNNTRLWVNYWFADYNEELGKFGRIINLCYPFYCVYITADKFTLRWFESSGNLGFLTELQSLMKTGYNNISLLDKHDKLKLASLIKQLLFLARHNILPLTLSVGLYDVIGYALFVKRIILQSSSPYPVIPISLGFIRVVLILPVINYIFRHMVGVTISFAVTATYLEVSIGSVMRNVDSYLANNSGTGDKIFANQGISHVVLLYKELQSLFKKVNQSMRYLVRNMLYFFCVGVTLVLTLMTLHTTFLIKIIMILGSVGCTSCFLGCTLLVAHLKSSLRQLYLKLNTLAARMDQDANNDVLYTGGKKAIMIHVSIWREKRQLLSAMKELGNAETNGQFVLGITDGEGGVTSSFQIFNLTLETVCLTLMFKNLLTQIMHQ